MVVERRTDGTDNSSDDGSKGSEDGLRAERFLEEHPMAKIVIIIDTHSMENGFFIWTGNSPEDYRACSLLEVSPRTQFNAPYILIIIRRSSETASPPGYSSIYQMRVTRRNMATRA